MGWLDRLLGVFRPRSVEAELEEEPAPAPQAAPPPPAPGPAKVEAQPPRPQKPPRPPKEERAPREPKASRKARKGLARPPAPAPAAEVLSVEEAERRYGDLVKPKATPAPAPAPAVEEAPEAPPPLQADPGAAARRAEASENRRRARVPRFQALVARADALLAVPGAGLRDLEAARRELADGWARLGESPEPEAEALVRDRDARLAALDERIGAARAALGEVHRQNLERKRAIVDEARALAEREDLRGAGPAMGELRTKLRAVGPVAPEDAEAVAAAFAEAEARLKARQEQLRATRDAAREEALARLGQLADQAEALARSADPEQAAQRAIALQKTWKEIRVPGPRGEADALWTRFRVACDAVFAARGKAREEAARATLDRMEQLVLRAEQLAADGVDGDPEREIEQLLAAWKKAGRAPREPQQALWERLTRAFDQLRAPPADLAGQDEGSLQFRPFEGLTRDEEG